MRFEDYDVNSTEVLPLTPDPRYLKPPVDEPVDLMALMQAQHDGRDEAFLAALDEAYDSHLTGENSRADLLTRWLEEDPELRYKDRRQRLFVFP